MYEHTVGDFVTPRGHPVKMWYRRDTCDFNTIRSSMDEDEYRLGHFPPFVGLAIDVGAYVGSVTIGLALDNPDLHVIALEPLPDNLELIRTNLRTNRVERVTVIEGAATKRGVKHVGIDYGFEGEEVGTHHAFVGNAGMPEVEHLKRRTHAAKGYSLLRLADRQLVRLIKIDCEGGEYDFLTDPAIRTVETILGEWHNHTPSGERKTRDDIVDLLGRTHRVSFTGPEHGPGGFLAERR